MNKYLVFLCLVMLLGCSKEADKKDVIEESSTVMTADNVDKKVMTFTDWEEVLSTCKMNKEELSIFEKENEFESFATKSNKVYESIDLNNVKTVEEIYEFVEKNKQYVEIMIDDEGEENFQPIIYQHPIANVISERKEIRIGNKIYKLEIGESDVLELKSDSVTFITLNRSGLEDVDNTEGTKFLSSYLFLGKRACSDIFQHTQGSNYRIYKQTVNIQRGPKRATGYIEISKNGSAPIKFLSSIKVQQRVFGVIWTAMDGQITVSYKGEIISFFRETVPVDIVHSQWGSTSYMTTNINVPNADLIFAPQLYTMAVNIFTFRLWDVFDGAVAELSQTWQCNEGQPSLWN